MIGDYKKVVKKINDITRSVIKNTERSPLTVLTHSTVGVLGEEYYKQFINPNVMEVNNPYFDFYDLNTKEKIEIKVSNLKNTNYIKLGNIQSIQSSNVIFDKIVIIERLYPVEDIFRDFITFKENFKLDDYYKFYMELSKEEYLKKRFKSKYDNFYYMRKGGAIHNSTSIR